MTKILFRCSSLPDLMTNGRGAGEMGETAKTVARDVWIKSLYGRERTDSINKYTRKGIMCETDGIDLIQKITGETYFKNQKQFSNSYISGTPDVVTRGKIVDVKNSFDIWTFSAVNIEKALKDYYWQLVGYMWLCGKKHADLAFTLVNTPGEIINDELYKLQFSIGEDKAQEYEKNYIFDDIPAEKRLKIFHIELKKDDVKLLKQRVRDARAYIKTLSI